MWIADFVDKFQHIVASYHQRGAVVVGMKAHLFGVQKVAVDEQRHFVVLVVDQRKERHAAGLHTEIFHHTLRAGKTKLSLMQTVFHIMDVHGETAVHDNKVVTVALVVSEEEVLAQCRPLATVELRGNLDGRCLGMLVVVKGNAHLLQCLIYLWLSYHSSQICFVILFNVKHIVRVSGICSFWCSHGARIKKRPSLQASKY